MSGGRLALTLTSVLLAGCSAKLGSSLPASAPVASYVGADAGVLGVEAAALEIDALQAELRRIARRSDAGEVEFTREAQALRLHIGAQGSFGAASAQLQPAALEFYAELASVLKARPGTVAHIVVLGVPASGEPATELSARRASSLQNYLASCGVPGTRIRAEGRSGDGERIELVLKPVLAGAESQAWVPPS